jgi:hypothetical protein
MSPETQTFVSTTARISALTAGSRAIVLGSLAQAIATHLGARLADVGLEFLEWNGGGDLDRDPIHGSAQLVGIGLPGLGRVGQNPQRRFAHEGWCRRSAVRASFSAAGMVFLSIVA